MSGWKTAGSEELELASVPAKLVGAKLGDAISQGELLTFVPCPFLRGIKEIPESFASLCALTCRLVLISCANVNAVFDTTLGGTLTRQLLRSVLKGFRTAVIVVASPEWCSWWKTQLTGKSVKAQRREVVEFSIGARFGKDSLCSGQEMLVEPQRKQAEELLKWYQFLQSAAGSSKKVESLEEEEEQEEDIGRKKGPKLTFVQYFHNTCGPLYPIHVLDEALQAAQEGSSVPPAVALSEYEQKRLTEPMAWTLCKEVIKGVSVYGDDGGVLVSDAAVSCYEQKLDAFLSCRGSFLSESLEKLQRCKSTGEVFIFRN